MHTHRNPIHQLVFAIFTVLSLALFSFADEVIRNKGVELSRVDKQTLRVWNGSTEAYMAEVVVSYKVLGGLASKKTRPIILKPKEAHFIRETTNLFDYSMEVTISDIPGYLPPTKQP